jgi:hypothetical protein
MGLERELLYSLETSAVEIKLFLEPAKLGALFDMA